MEAPDTAHAGAVAARETSLFDGQERRIPGRVLAVAGGLSLAGFLALAWAAHGIAYFPIDVAITQALQQMNPALALPLDALSYIGFPPIVTIGYALIVLGMFLTRHRLAAVGAGLATLGAAGLTDLIKVIVQRPRPSADLVKVAHHIESFGYPAGHVLNATAFVGFLAYLAWARMAPSWQRTALLTLFLAVILLMGPARIYAGEHWPSDVLGAYLIALAWLVVPIAFYQWRRGRRAA
jgi:undecaprenyl-diphosphatase